MNDEKKTLEDYLEKGKFYFLSEKYDLAIREFKDALKLDEKNTDVLYSLGIAYESSNKLADARKTYLKTLEYDPNHKLAKEHLDKMIEK
ncbi:MAG: tetratricopeptide repeat protein [Elusimicrobia bacterium]|nr:tetratricopeptide repeat protein [Elusimicrobiota bacterium]